MLLKFVADIAEKHVPIEFTIYDNVVEQIISDSRDFTIFGLETIEEFGDYYTQAQAKEILLSYPSAVHEITSGGRLDILLRTNAIVIVRLKKLNYDSSGNAYILLARYLWEAGNDEDVAEALDGMNRLDSLDHALDVLDFLKERIKL